MVPWKRKGVNRLKLLPLLMRVIAEHHYNCRHFTWRMNMSVKLQHTSSRKDHNTMKTILVVEDDEHIGEFIVEAFIQETPYQALLATDGKQALKIVQKVRPN